MTESFKKLVSILESTNPKTPEYQSLLNQILMITKKQMDKTSQKESNVNNSFVNHPPVSAPVPQVGYDPNWVPPAPHQVPAFLPFPPPPPYHLFFHPVLSQPKISASNNPTPPEFSTPNTTSNSTSTITTTSNTPVPTSATIPIASTQLGSNNNSNPPLSTSFNTPIVTTPTTPTTSVPTTSTTSTIHTSNTNPVSSVNPSSMNSDVNPMTKINWNAGITHPFKPPLPPSPSQISNTIDSSLGQKFPSPASSSPLMITDGSELGSPKMPITPPPHKAGTSFANDNSDVTENLLATPAGLVPVSASIANNADVVDAIFTGTPPPFPSAPKPNTTTSQEAFTETIKNLPKTSDNDSVNFSLILKTANGKAYSTTITQDTTVAELTQEQLLKELEKRQLIKKDDGNTKCDFLLKNNTVEQVGESSNGYKLTQQGQAYHETLPKPEETIKEQTKPFPENIENNLRIGVVPMDNDTFIQEGKTKHLNLAAIDDPKENYVIVIGYLTSKSSGQLLNEKQYKIFENEKEGKSENKDKQGKLPKPQKIVLYETPYKIDKKDFKEVKWDEEYIQTISQGNLSILSKNGEQYWQNGVKDFPQNELSYERGLEMCKAHDLNAQQKKPKHPITKDQKKQNEENNNKQHEKNKEKYEENNKLQE